jgi:hypothetical protein
VTSTVEVTDNLRERFGQDDIYLLGQSWGSTLGVNSATEFAAPVYFVQGANEADGRAQPFAQPRLTFHDGYASRRLPR